MRGLLVVGCSSAADVDAATAALAEELKASGSPARAVDASTLGEMAPGALVGSLRERSGGQTLVAGVPGGMLAPITGRYSARELARDLGLPVVLAVAADADAVPIGRLTAEASRSAGLTVAAMLLTGSGARVDRDLLGDGIAVHALDERLPVNEWLAAAPPPADRGRDSARTASEMSPALAEPTPRSEPPSMRAVSDAPSTPGRVVLEPYTEWQPAALVGDPRGTPRPRIMEAMLAIVEAEGPMRASRAYSLYTKASGGKKVTTVARAPLSSAIYWLAQERKLTLVKKDEIPWQDDDVVRALDSPPVRMRELGSRTLDEVPLDEIAELMRRLRDARVAASEAQLKRAVLDAYGLIRMTQRADEYLGLAFALL